MKARIGGLARALPLVGRMQGYQSSWLRADLVAGVSIFAVLVPSAMAYAALAGLEPIIGLYASLVGMILYALFASSPHLVVGPEAGTSILVASMLLPLGASGNPARYAALAAMMAIMAGVFLIAAGFLRLGFMSEYMSKPVLMGFMNGAVLIILGSQLGKIMGMSLEQQDFFPKLVEAVQKVEQTNLATLGIAVASMALIIILKAFRPRWPSGLIVVILGIALGFLLDLPALGVAVVGYIPPGLPMPSVPRVGFNDLLTLIPGALGVALLTFPNSVLTARVFADKDGYQIDANRELRAVGFANLGAGFFSGFPVSGSQSRSSVNYSAGAKTPVSSLVGAAVLAIFLLFLTPVLRNLPIAALGVIVILSAISLFDVKGVAELFRIHFLSGVLSVITTLGVLTIGIIPAILIAVVLSLFYIISRISRPHDAILGMSEAEQAFAEIDPSTISENPFPGLIAYRFDAQLFFANASFFIQRARQLIAAEQAPVKWFLLSAEAITDIDVTAAEILVKFVKELRGQGITIAIARASNQLREAMAHTGLTEVVGEERFYKTVRAGVQAYLRENPEARQKVKLPQ